MFYGAASLSIRPDWKGLAAEGVDGGAGGEDGARGRFILADFEREGRTDVTRRCAYKQIVSACVAAPG